MTYFAGKELAKKLTYLKSQGKELDLSINYPKMLEVLVKFYISVFGIPEIGLQERFRFFQNSIVGLKPKIIIDAGCGSGIYSRYLATRYSKSKIYAIEIDNKLIIINKKLTEKKNIFYMKRNLLNPLSPIIKKVDFIYSIDVLEHIKDYKKTLINFSQVLKKKGYLLLHIPLKDQKKHFNYFKKWSHRSHVREGFSEKELINYLTKINFKIIKKIGTFGTVGSFLWELNTLLFKKTPLLAAMTYPFLRFLLPLDTIFKSKKYNCLGILAKKN